MKGTLFVWYGLPMDGRVSVVLANYKLFYLGVGYWSNGCAKTTRREKNTSPECVPQTRGR